MARILLIEDDEISRDMLKLRLELRGYEVITAADGQEGVDLAASGQPQLILMDMNLPVMDGWTATSRLKQSPLTSTIPIIGVSAHAMSGDREKALRAGCNDYEAKPVDWSQLLPKIEALLESIS